MGSATPRAARIVGRPDVIRAALLAAGFWVVWQWAPGFGHIRNLAGMATWAAPIGIVACAMLFVLRRGDLDLSPEGTLALGGVVAALVVDATGSAATGAAAGIASGAVVGCINGVAVVQLRAHGVLVSLVTLHLARGIALLASDGAAVGAADPFFDLIASATLMRVSSPVYVLVGCVVAAGLAAGLGCLGTPQSVTARGRIGAYAVVGAAAGLAGVVMTARDGVAQPMAASGLSFDVLCACALGGASLRGGRGTVVGMLLGVAMVAVALNVMALTHAPAGAHYMMQGAVLAAALLGPERLPRP